MVVVGWDLVDCALLWLRYVRSNGEVMVIWGILENTHPLLN